MRPQKFDEALTGRCSIRLGSLDTHGHRMEPRRSTRLLQNSRTGAHLISTVPIVEGVEHVELPWVAHFDHGARPSGEEENERRSPS